MTLDEMIKQEQNNAQNQQQAAQPAQAQQTQQTVNQVAQQTTQSTQQSNNQSNNQNNAGRMIHTIASSSDENVNKEEFSLKTKQYEPVVIPEDFYKVKLVGIDKKEAKAFDSEELVPNFIWKFEVISDSTGKELEKPVTISKWCKAYSKGERSHNYQFYMALMQETPEYGYNILDCIGKYARAYISQKSWNDSKTGVKMTKSIIEKLLPVKK